MAGQQYRHLNATERQYICQYIAILVPVARDQTHPMKDVARSEIAMAMWRWTVDGVNCETGVVKKNAIKFDLTLQRATKSAIELFDDTGKIRGLRHEHVVPRMELARRIIDRDLNVEGIAELLGRFCFAVVVTQHQDTRLARCKMPLGWCWNSGNPLQRYVDAGLHDEIVIAPLPERIDDIV